LSPDSVAQYASLIGGGGSFFLMLIFIVRVFKGLLDAARTDATEARAEAIRLTADNIQLRAENEMLRGKLYRLGQFGPYSPNEGD
jgi:hypothetical protein